MKKIFTLVFPVGLLITISLHAQDRPSDALHSNLKSTSQKNASSILPALPELIQSLNKQMSVDQRTDVLTDIATNYLNKLKIDSALFYINRIKKISDSANYEAGLGKYDLGLAGAYYYRRRHEEAMNYLDQAVQIFSKYQLSDYLALTYRQLGREYTWRGNHDMCRYYYRKAFQSFTGNQSQLLLTSYNLGMDFYSTYEIDSAVYYLTQTLEIAEKLHDEAWKYNASTVLGELYVTLGDVDHAGKHLSYAVENNKPGFDKVLSRELWGYYTEYFILKRDYDHAETSLKEFERLNASLGDAMGNIIDKKLHGELSYARADYIDALGYLKEAYSRRQEISSYKSDILNISIHLALAELKTGRTDSAIMHLHSTRDLAKGIGFVVDEMQSDRLLSEAFQVKNNNDSAFHYFRFYTALKDSVLSIQKEKTIMELSARYDAQKREQEIKDLLNQKQLYAYQIQLKNKTIEQQILIDTKKSQQLTLLTQQSEIDRLQASEKNLAIQNGEKEILKKQNELQLSKKEGQLQSAIASQQARQKQMAFVVIVAVILLALVGWYRYRQNKKLSAQLAASLVELKQAQALLIKTEKEKEAEDLRSRISRDIHDEVGATLSGVALFSEIAKQKMSEHREKDAQEYLEHISVNSKEMVEKMSDIIWTINPKNDSFERIIFKLQSYMMNLCSGKSIQAHYSIDEEIRHFSFSMQERKNIYLLVKEAINNAVKYSGATNIYFSMQKERQWIKIEVKDDGKGFSSTEINEGNGIANMKARAKELDGSLVIDSLPGNGTSIQLQAKFHPHGVQA